MARALLSQSPMFHSRTPVLYLVGALALASGRPAAADSHSSHAKVDRAVRESVQQGAPTQSVIISVKPGYRDQLLWGTSTNTPNKLSDIVGSTRNSGAAPQGF